MSFSLNVGRPTRNQVVQIGVSFEVKGSAMGASGPEHVVIDAVTVQVDQQAPVEAQLVRVPRIPVSDPQMVNFSASVQVATGVGTHNVIVRATDSNGNSISQTVPVIVGIPPLDSTFTGSSTLRTTNSHAIGPFVSGVTIGVEFSIDRKTVTVTTFPPITTPPFSTPFGTDTVTVFLVSSGSGTFDPTTKALSIPIVLLFHHSLNIPLTNLDSTLSLMLTTGQAHSPTGAFNDLGSPLDQLGPDVIVLVGDGQFVSGFLGGNDASLILTGTISPHP